MTDKSSIFYKPNIKRDEPRVLSQTFDTSFISKTTDEDVLETANKIKLLLDTYTSLEKGYESMLNVLIKRAALREIKIDVAELDINKSVIARAGIDISSEITYAEFLNIMKYEAKLASSYIGQINNGKDVDFKNNPDVLAITAIKERFIKELYDKEAVDLMQGLMIIKRSSEIQSARSVITKINELNVDEESGETMYITSALNGPPSDKDKTALEKIIAECIPCAERNLGRWENFIASATLKDFLNLYIDNLINGLVAFAQSKLAMVGNYFAMDICNLVNMLSGMCLPDLKSILALLTSMYFKLMKLFKPDFDALGITLSLGTMLSIGSKAAIDSIYGILLKLASIVFSSIDCIIGSITGELNHLNISNELRDMGAPGAEVFDTIQDGSDYLSDARREVSYVGFVRMLRDAKQSMDNQLAETAEQLNKATSWSYAKEGDIVYLFEDLQRLSIYISLLQEITVTIGAYGNQFKYGPNSERLYKAICYAAVNNRFPWLTQVTDALYDLKVELKDGLNNKDNKDEPDNRDLKDPVEDIDIEEDDGDLIIIDESLDDDFIEDPIKDIFDNDIIKDRIDKSKYYDSKVLDEYNNTMNMLNKNNNRINLHNQTADLPITGAPVSLISFANCRNENNLGSYSSEQIQDWIDRVTR